MDLISILLIAVALAMDAFAVSITGGVCSLKMKVGEALKFGLYFGTFQFFMPVAGWALSLGFREFIEGYDHWVAFGLLCIIGIRMIVASFRKGEEKTFNMTSFKNMLMLAVATSIDALAVGVSFAFLRIFVVFPAAIIGVVAFLFSFIGYYIGCRTGKLFGNRIELAGGIILIGIGVKILAEHVIF